MAGPLDWFRKKQKLLLAVFGILLMFTFLITGSVDFSGSGNEGVSGESVVATWKKGEFTARELSTNRHGEAIMTNFLATIYQQGAERGGEARASVFPRSASNEGLVRKLILTTEAEKQGIRVDDEAALDYLRRLSGGTVRNNEFPQLLKAVSQGQMSDAQLMHLVKRELTAQRFITLALSGIIPATPVASWDFYNRLERQVSAEMLPIDVDDFVAEITDPSDEEIADFFDEYKDRHSSPMDPEPGFNQRKKLAFQYVCANYSELLTAVESDVSDEEIAEFYELNKDDEFQLGEDNEDAQETSADDLEIDGLEVSSDESAGDDSDAITEPDRAGVTDESANDEPGTDEPGTDEPGTDDLGTDDLGTDDLGTDDLGTDDLGTDDLGTDEPGTDDLGTDDLGTDDLGTDEPGTDEPGTDEPGTDDLGTDDLGTDKPGTDEPGTDKPGTEPKYKPLDEVRDDIRTRLARPLAQAAMEEVLATARNRIQNYYDALIRWDVDKITNADLPAPEFPDFADLVEAGQIEFGEIPLVDRFEVEQHDLGRAYELNVYEGGYQQVTFAQFAYSDNLPNYKYREIPAYEIDSKFGFWKTDSQEPRVPELEDIHDEVVLHWKRLQAIDRATAYAQEQAEKARADGRPLAQCDIEIGDRTIIQTGDVNWFTGGSVPLGGGGAPRLGSIPGVPGVGYDFMKTLFRTNVGEISVAMDVPKNRVYLIRVEAARPDVEVRRDGFLEMGGGLPGVRQLASQDSTRFVSQFINELMDEYGVEWETDPDAQGEG